MAMSTPSNYTSIQMLPEEQKFNGENYVSFRAIILPTGRLKGLHLYWEGQVVVPDSSNPDTTSKPSASSSPEKSAETASSSPAPTAINDPKPTMLEYEMRKPVAYLTLWNNIKNLDGLGIPHGLMSHKLWKYLKTEFQMVTAIARQWKEDNL
ncbi:hypothetical protein FB446DRAFT_709452 [Lentinula raphanica]|nr:hypothetical protein FB446DRAFT_709452 [Lentinula raphanica]